MLVVVTTLVDISHFFVHSILIKDTWGLKFHQSNQKNMSFLILKSQFSQSKVGYYVVVVVVFYLVKHLQNNLIRICYSYHKSGLKEHWSQNCAWSGPMCFTTGKVNPKSLMCIYGEIGQSTIFLIEKFQALIEFYSSQLLI